MTDALQAADSNDFVDVQIITLRQYLSELAHLEAWNHVDVQNDPVLIMQARAEVLMKTKYTHAHEFVEVSDNRIVVGVNVDKIDDAAVDRAMVLLSEVEEFNAGVRIDIGDLVQIYGS